MPNWLKLTAGLLLTLLVVALGAAAFAPLLINKQQILSDLEADISLSLGRPTQIESIGLLQLLPIPRLRLEGVRVAESAAVDAPTLATVDALQLDAAIWPLVTGRLVLAEVLIERPRVSLPLAPTPSAAVPAAAASAPTRARKRAPGATSRVRPSGASYSSLLVVDRSQPSVPGPSTDSASDARATQSAQPLAANDQSAAEPEAEAEAEAGATPPASIAYPPTLPPIRRLMIRDGELSGSAQPAGPSSAFSLGALNLTAGPIAPGRNGRLDATFRAGIYTSSPDQSGFALPGLAEAEISLADPLTEVALRPLRLRLDSSAGGQRPPIEIDVEVLIDLMTGRVAIDPLELIADRLRLIGAAQLFPTPAGLGIDSQLQVPAFDLRTWLSEQASLTLPGDAASLRRLGGQLDLQLRGPVMAIDNASMTVDQTRVNAVARLRLPPPSPSQNPSAPVAGQLALALDRLVLDPYLPGAETVAAPTVSSNAVSMMPPVLPPLPPLPQQPEISPPAQGLHLQLAAGELRLGGLGFSSVELGGQLLQEALELDSTAEFYGGWLETRFAATQLHASIGGAGPDLRLEATAGDVDVAVLLADLPLGAGKQPPITGLGEIDLNLDARGADPASIIPSLGGEAAFAVRDGAVTMVDLGQLITGTIGAIGVSPEDAENLTRFSALSLSAQGTEGQFSSEDIQLRSNLLNIDGSGQLDLTTQQIALDLQAVMTKPPKGQGRGIKELEGIPIPISAAGPWADPRWEVDIRAALDAAAQRALREDNGLFDEIEERTGIKGLGDGLRQILPGLLGR